MSKARDLADFASGGGGALSRVNANVQTANYTLDLSDAGKMIFMLTNSALTLTIPLASSVNFPAGTKIDMLRAGLDELTIAPTSGVTIISEGNKQRINAAWQAATLIKTGGDQWTLIGALKA